MIPIIFTTLITLFIVGTTVMMSAMAICNKLVSEVAPQNVFFIIPGAVVYSLFISFLILRMMHHFFPHYFLYV